MRKWTKIAISAVLLVLTMMLGEQCHAISSMQVVQGEYKAQGTPTPVSDDYGLVFNAPAQVPALAPNPSSMLVTPAKYRTSLMRTNILRRSLNRLISNVYAPISVTGRLVVERMTSPLRCGPAVHFYVFELCRLLC